MKHRKELSDSGMGGVSWVFCVLFLVLNMLIGVGIIVSIADIQTTLKFMDVACPIDPLDGN